MSHGINGPDDGPDIVMAEIGKDSGPPSRHGARHKDQRVKVGADGVAISGDQTGSGVDGPEPRKTIRVIADIIEHIGPIPPHVSCRKGQASVASVSYTHLRAHETDSY